MEVLYDKLAKCFETKFNNEINKRNKDKHCNWYDKHNFGVTYFGIHPKLLPLSSIEFNGLHCRLSIVRKIIGYLCKYLEHYGYKIQDAFAEIL